MPTLLRSISSPSLPLLTNTDELRHVQTSISLLGDVVRETELIGLENVLGRITARPINLPDCRGQQLVGREKAFGFEAVSAGVALQVCHLPILATAGITTVEVFARLRVGMITLPDQRSCDDFSESTHVSTCELSPGVPLRGLVESLGAEVYETRLPNASSATLGRTLQLMLSNYPLVLISGFLSPGQASTLHDALCERGAIASVQDVVMPDRLGADRPRRRSTRGRPVIRFRHGLFDVCPASLPFGSTDAG